MRKQNHSSVRHRTPYEMPTVTDYSSRLNKFILQTESLLRRKLIAMKYGKVDKDMQTAYLDSIVDAAVAQEFSEYNQLFNADQSRIRDAVMKMDADRVSLESLSNQIGVELAGLQAELDSQKSIYKHNNPLRGGHVVPNAGKEEDDS